MMSYLSKHDGSWPLIDN